MKKTLGTLEAKLLQTLQNKGKNIFGLKDAMKITKSSYDATRIMTGKLVNKGWLTRIKKGKYLILSLQEEANTIKDWYSIAPALVEPYPYYLSYYTALAIHNMTTQPVLAVYISTPKRATKRKIGKITFNFIFCPADKLWGLEEKWVSKQQKIKVSDPEKTILDCLMRPKLCGGISEIAKAIWLKRNEINYEKLLKYCRQLKTASVNNRLGFLLQLYGLGNKNLYYKLKKQGQNRPLLDPTLPKRGSYFKEWNLIINSEPEELKKIIWT